jgi:hypothetical protein
MTKLTKSQARRKHIETLRRRLDWLLERDGGSYDEREAAATRAAIDCLKREEEVHHEERD